MSDARKMLGPSLNCVIGSGCRGGYVIEAFQFIQKNGGIKTEENHPYEGEVKLTVQFKGVNEF